MSSSPGVEVTQSLLYMAKGIEWNKTSPLYTENKLRTMRHTNCSRKTDKIAARSAISYDGEISNAHRMLIKMCCLTL